MLASAASYGLLKIDYENVYELMTKDAPIEHKILAGGFLIGVASLGSLAIADGLIDMVKGTHHYVGLNLVKKITRNPERKKKIDEIISNIAERSEEPLFSRN